MMTLHYTGGSVLIANDVCEALLQYARALAATQASDVLLVPVRGEDGVLTTAEFLIGPASQLLAVPMEGMDESGRDQAVIDEIDRRAQLLSPSVAVARDEAGESAWFDHDSS